MEKFVIMGGKRLVGDVTVSGAKNAAVAAIPAALLAEGTCRIENVPQIKDVDVILDIMKYLGAKVKKIGVNTLEISCEKISGFSVPYEMTKKMRASYYFVGALLGRFCHAEVPPPGGCCFGNRPIDMHIKGFEALGAKVSIDRGIVEAHATQLEPAQIFLDVVSVGATINIMLAAVRVKGTTIIENAAKEPHVVDVANFLNAMGANVRGAGTDTIKIKGVDKMSGGTYTLIPDQIEAGTFMVAAAATCGDITVKNIIPKHLESITAKLVEMNVIVEEFDDSVRVRRDGSLCKANIKTMPYPGFPTDLQPQTAALLSVAEGTSIITEGIWDNRFQYVDELRRLGAQISVDGKIAVVEGVKKLSGADVKATDLRAGAGLVIAALMAEGITQVHELFHIDRGYENLEQKLKNLGAQIVRRDDGIEKEEAEVI
ncbi:MAG: UDP-N-acetylglucosamine 1-carboxyvinyltransferase [Firmicutes bacterium]|nr:UDP-N-acetylglucosamine 1-carboxyvinyltransferase [Bacillota bacterium]